MIRGKVHSSPKAVEDISISDSYGPDDHFEQKLLRDSFESGFQKMRILQNKWELWLHSKFMDMPSVIKKIKELEPGNHYLPLLHLYLRVICLRHECL